MRSQRKLTWFGHTNKNKQNEYLFEKNLKEAVALRVELCKVKIDSMPSQAEICKPICYTYFLRYKAHMVILYVEFEKLCRAENLF